MRKESLSLLKYITHILKSYQELKKVTEEQAAYKLIDISDPNALVVQIAGTTNTFKAAPEEILGDNELVKQFSSLDMRTITYLGCQKLNEPKSKVVLKHFCRKRSQMIFSIEHTDTKQVEEKTARTISSDTSLIERLKPEEAYSIGFTAANENEVAIAEEMALLRNKKEA